MEYWIPCSSGDMWTCHRALDELLKDFRMGQMDGICHMIRKLGIEIL